MDMTDSIAPRSDQMNAEDMLAGPRTFTITDVRVGKTDEQPVSVFVAEHPQPFKPSKTVRRIMVFAWGPDSQAYIGKRMTLYRDPAVKFGGQDVGGIRVSHMSGITRRLEVQLAVTRGKRAPYVVEPLTGPAPSPMDALVFAFNTAGITGKTERLAYCKNVVRHPLKSAADLTADEVTAVIAALNPAQVPSDPTDPPADESFGLELDIPEPAHQNEQDHLDARRDPTDEDLEPTDAEIEAELRRRQVQP